VYDTNKQQCMAAGQDVQTLWLIVMSDGGQKKEINALTGKANIQ